MSGLMRTVVSVILLAVLSGAPAVAVICAELCPPVAQATESGHQGMPCHGSPSSAGPVIGDTPQPECGDHGTATVRSVASLASSRQDLAAFAATGWSGINAALTLSSGSRGRPSPATYVPPARPARSSLVLRI